MKLRICSGHFSGGEKKDGDIPVPDPEIDTPLCIELPPKEPKGDRKRLKMSVSSPGSMIRNSRSLLSPNHHFSKHVNNNNATVRSSLTPTSYPRGKAHHFGGSDFQTKRQKQGPSSSSSKSCDFSSSDNCRRSTDTILPGAFHYEHAKNYSIEDLLSASSLSKHMNSLATTSKPLVALLDGRDCSVEMPHLKDIATVAFCDAQTVQEIHDRVLKEAVAVLIWHTIRLTKDDLRKFRCLRLIVRIGVDYDNVDIKSAGELGIAVCNVTGFCIEEVADSTLCMILSLYRKVDASVSAAYNLTRRGLTKLDFWKSNSHHNSDESNVSSQNSGRIKGQKLGLVGLGAVGVAVAIRAKAFAFDVRFYDPYLPDGVEKSLGIGRYATLHDALQESDCISLHCPLNEHTKNLINDFSLRQMKPGAFLVNTARTELIDEIALSKFLKEKRLAGAAVDICGPKLNDDRLREIFRDTPNLLCTPNSSWYSPCSYREVREAAAMEIRRALTSNGADGGAGIGRHWTENLRNCVNRQYLSLNNQNKQNGLTTNETSQGRNSVTGLVPRLESAAFGPYAHQQMNFGVMASGLGIAAQQSMLQNNFPFNFLPSTPPYGHHQFFHQASSSSSSSLNNPPPRGFMDFLQQNHLAAVAAAAAGSGQLPPPRSVSPPTAANRQTAAAGVESPITKKAPPVASNGRAVSAARSIEEPNGGVESPTTSSSSAANLSSNDSTPSPKRTKNADAESSAAVGTNDASVKDNEKV